MDEVMLDCMAPNAPVTMLLVVECFDECVQMNEIIYMSVCGGRMQKLTDLYASLLLE